MSRFRAEAHSVVFKDVLARRMASNSSGSNSGARWIWGGGGVSVLRVLAEEGCEPGVTARPRIDSGLDGCDKTRMFPTIDDTAHSTEPERHGRR